MISTVVSPELVPKIAEVAGIVAAALQGIKNKYPQIKDNYAVTMNILLSVALAFATTQHIDLQFAITAFASAWTAHGAYHLIKMAGGKTAAPVADTGFGQEISVLNRGEHARQAIPIKTPEPPHAPFEGYSDSISTVGLLTAQLKTANEALEDTRKKLSEVTAERDSQQSQDADLRAQLDTLKRESDLNDVIDNLDLDKTTPLDALNFLAAIQNQTKPAKPTTTLDPGDFNYGPMKPSPDPPSPPVVKIVVP